MEEAYEWSRKQMISYSPFLFNDANIGSGGFGRSLYHNAL